MESGSIILDTNDNGATSASFSTEGATRWTFYVTTESGDNDNHVVILQIRPDNSVNRYFAIGDPITGPGVFSVPGEYIGSEVRLKVTTPEGTPSSSKCYIFGN